MERLALTATVLAAMGSGLMGGFFYAFSGTVMAALGRIPPSNAILAMQVVNVVVLRPLFLVLFLGTAATSLLLVALAPMGSASAFAAAGGIVYLGGVLLVTVVVNVPMNEALAAVVPDGPVGPSAWAGYLRRWTIWNHVRALSGTGAFGLFLAAILND